MNDVTITIGPALDDIALFFIVAAFATPFVARLLVQAVWLARGK